MSDPTQPTLIHALSQQTRKRRRVKFEFWMDATKPDQSILGDRLWKLKGKRQFAPTLRKAVQLFFSLMDGDISVLKELFPDVVTQLETDAYRRGTAESDSYEVAQLKHMIQKLDEKLDAVPAGNPKPLTVPALATPDFDDDDDFSNLLTVKKSTGNGKQASQNFLNSVMNL